MKPTNQLSIEFPRVNERMRDSEGRYATELQVAENKIEYLTNQNEVLTRKYLALSRMLASAQRELQTLKNKA